ncbi:MAG: hypothetical protein ABI630_05125 [Betaproteobacteria bacterium]
MKARLSAAALAAGLLAACSAALPVATPPVAAPPRPIAGEAPREMPADKRAGELVSYFAAVARAGAGEQKRELSQSAAAFGRAATPYARLKLGGLYAQPGAGLRDDARALALLEPLAANASPGTDRPLADLASLLHAQVAERQRTEKAESRKQEALREQIEAMKSIDRSILRREERQRANVGGRQ